MKYHKQSIINHDPENGVFGDCYRTVIACMLDFESIEHVPHFGEGNPSSEEFWGRVNEFLETRSLKLVRFGFSNRDVEEVLFFMRRTNPGIEYIIGGASPRGFDHACIARDEKIIHDPHPSGGGIVGPDSEGFVTVEIIALALS